LADQQLAITNCLPAFATQKALQAGIF